MNILEKIAQDKRKEIEMKKEYIPRETFEMLPFYNRNCISLSKKLKKAPGIITEFKRKSPSQSQLNLNADIEEISLNYQNAGASGISILTDEIYFGGLMDDILLVRDQLKIPILRKDFLIDEYQILESKAIGADVILLIAALLSPKEIQQFSKTAHDLGMEVLLEVHNEEELQRSLTPNLNLVGVNNRNLKNFDVDIEISKNLSEKIPSEFVKISESGICEASTLKELLKYDFKGFLIGGEFMKAKNPAKRAETLINALKS